MTKDFRELQGLMPGTEIRLILVNDGSNRNMPPALLQEMTHRIPVSASSTIPSTAGKDTPAA